MIKLAFITDEATQDIEEAIQFAKTYGLQGLELRSVEDKPIDEIVPSRWKEYHQLIEEAGLQVPNLAGSFFKCNPYHKDEVKANIQKLKRLCDAADIFECNYVRGFSFFAPKEGQLKPQELVPYFDEPLKILKERKKILLLESDPSVNTTNHAAIADLLSFLDSLCFGAIYDPGNDIYDPDREVPFPDGYEKVKRYIHHIHIKDAIYDENGKPQCVRIGDGLVGYPDLLRRLLQDKYNGWLSLETHYRKHVTLTEEQMRIPQGSAFSSGGMEAAVESTQALKKLLEEAKKPM